MKRGTPIGPNDLVIAATALAHQLTLVTHNTGEFSCHIDMTTIRLSCGLLVINERLELLIGHSTGSAHWDLPKGLIDPGEDPMTCARREAREEFGLEFSPDRLIDLGRHPYYRGKDLHLFGVKTTSTETRVERCCCTSYFEHYRTGKEVPEVDEFAWADDAQLQTRLAHSMRRLLLEKALLAHARTLIQAA